MVYFFITVFWPGNKAPEVAKASFQSQKKFPEDASLGKYVIYGAAIPGENVGRSISVFEPARGKERDALMWIAKRLYLYILIEGVSYKRDTAVNYDEALEIAGIKRE